VNAQTVGAIDGTNTPDLTIFVGEINLIGNAKTYFNQTYRAGVMRANAVTPGSEVVFSIFDPSAGVTFALPVKSDGSGLINLLNPGSVDLLTINGATNFISAPNLSGQDNWGQGFTNNLALNAKPIFQGDLNLQPRLADLKKLTEFKEDDALVGEVTIDELEEGDPNCVKNDPNQALDPKCALSAI
jgi:hypothetical protein